MFNERLPEAGGRGPQEEEFGDKNSRFGNGFHDHFGNDRGGRRADFYNQHGGGRRRDRHVHFDDKDEARDEYDEGFDDNENSFAHHGRFGQPYEHRRGAFQNFQKEKILIHILSGRSNVIKFIECIISLTKGVSTLLVLSFRVILSHGGIKYKKISLCWDVIISIHGLK